MWMGARDNVYLSSGTRIFQHLYKCLQAHLLNNSLAIFILMTVLLELKSKKQNQKNILISLAWNVA